MQGSNSWLANLGLSWKHVVVVVSIMERHLRKLFLNNFMIVDGFRCNKEDLNYLNNNQQTTSMDKTKKSASTLGGKIEKVSHQEDRK